MNELAFLHTCEVVLATVLALALLRQARADVRLPLFLRSVGWHGPGDGS